MMRVAFYRGTHPGLPGIYNRLVRWFMHGPYSHCELVFSDGVSASSSYMDGGVRFKSISYSSTEWDFIDLPGYDEDYARQWFDKNRGAKYDLMGNLGFVFRPITGEKGEWFCSESVAAALGIPESWRFDPNALHAALTHIFDGVVA